MSTVDVLDASAKSLRWWLEFWTFLVGVGLVVEYAWPIWVFFKRALATRSVRGIDLPESTIRTVVGGILITVGVIGEFWVEFNADAVETALRFENARIILELGNDVEAEKTRGKGFEAQAKGFESQIKGFDAQIADANSRAKAAEAIVAGANAASREAVAKLASAEARIAEAQRDSVEANKKAAELQKDAEATRLETEKLKQVVAWREIPPTVAGNLEKLLAARPGAVNLRYTDGDPESLFLAIQLARVLERAKWKVAPGAIKFANALQFGIALPDAGSSDAQTLRSAFSGVGISFTTDPLPPMGAAFSILTINGAPTLMVGSRAPATLK